MFDSKVTVLLCVSLLALHCDAARILAIVPTPSFSHQVAFHSLWRELSLRGHQLTLATTNPINDPTLTNLTEIDLHFIYQHIDTSVVMDIRNPLKLVDQFRRALIEAMELELQHPGMQALIKNDSYHFDLLMVEYLNPTMIAFSERFNCPYIGLTSLDAPTHAHIAAGNPLHPALYPDVTLPFGGKLTFFERVISTVYHLFLRWAIGYYTNLQEPLVEKYFGSGYSSLEKLYGEVSLLFININPILYDLIRPDVPTIVNIGGGSHVRPSSTAPSKSLPKDLQDFMDSATDGVIYFSLGSNVKSIYLPQETQQLLLKVFSELPYKVLWKFELDLPEKPENVLISKWFPQQDIFRHPNLKLFITQGGVQSMEEAIFNYVPMVVMPFFGDQMKNARRVVKQGLGLTVEYGTLTKDSFKSAILEIINNPMYRDNVKKLVDLVQDEPMSGIERAIWWTEYVLRHKGAKHLKSPISDIPMYQYLLLDIIGFCLLVVSIVFYVLIKFIKLLVKIIGYLRIRSKVKVQ